MIDKKYIVIISENNKGFTLSKMVFGPFNSTEEIKDWLKNKYNNWRYTIDIHPILDPNYRFHN